jgi:uncharacterized protein (TIGR03435 family)
MNSALLEHLWQSTWFALGAALVTLALRKNPARIRYWVWLAAGAKFLIPFSVLMRLGGLLAWRPTTSASPLSESFVNVVRDVAAPLATPQISMHTPAAAGTFIGPVLLAIWAVGSVALLARWMTRWIRVSAAVHGAVPLQIEAPVPVRCTPTLSEPGVVGILRPVLLLPAGIVERLTEKQLKAILAHELCHIRRRDNLTAALHMLVEAVFWFHPFVWWIGTRLVEERERACDQDVLEHGNESETYAEGILKVCRFYVESQLACVAGVSGADLKKRIEAIMKNPVTLQLTAARKALLAAASALAIAVPFAAGVMSAPRAIAQATQGTDIGPLAFDTISIVNAPDTPMVRMILGPNKGDFKALRVPLREIIAEAYGLDNSQVVGGPEWVDKPLYQITAHTSRAVSDDQMKAAMQAMGKSMLAARFGLIAHPETQTLPAFVMRVDAGGSRLSATQAQQPGGQVRFNLGGHPDGHAGAVLVGTSSDMQVITTMLERQLARPVLDQTGLTGRYDFTLTGIDPGKTESARIELVAAVREQLGLSLEPATAPVAVLVIDSIQRPKLDAPLAQAVTH